MKGGEYVVKVSGNSVPDLSRMVTFESYSQNVFQLGLALDKLTYDLEDTVKVVAEAAYSSGKEIQELTFTLELTVNAKHQWREERTLHSGAASFEFPLPPKKKVGTISHAQVSISVSDGTSAQVKSVDLKIGAQTFTAKTAFVEFYPEGGRILEAFVNRVYFEALDEHGQPVDFSSQL